MSSLPDTQADVTTRPKARISDRALEELVPEAYHQIVNLLTSRFGVDEDHEEMRQAALELLLKAVWKWRHETQAEAQQRKAAGKAAREWRAAVAARDGKVCQDCGAPATDAHHIVPIQADPERRHDVENGVMVCRACHRERHRTLRQEAGNGR